MQAIKGNREYSITESDKNKYLKQGFDIFEGGKQIASGEGKTIPYEEYVKVTKELEELKKALEETGKEQKPSRNHKTKNEESGEGE